ncbi:MAG: hypothetical protein QG670_340 [Thermoproteota archaeon]|nr:hypothetical protein [Thermoproteota archaeon]
MLNLVSKCGIACSTCPWGPYPRNTMTAKDFDQYRNNAKRILGYMPIKTPCPTCQTPNSKIPAASKLPNLRCLIRQCVDKSGIANCAYCKRFPCDTVKATGGAWHRKSIEERLGTPISEEEYHMFVEPFEGISRLMTIRATFRSEEIVEPAIAHIKTEIAGFPENLPFPKDEKASFKAVHKLLTTIKESPLGLRDPDTFAQQRTLENRRAHVLRFLWILGCYGKFENDKGVYLVVDTNTYEANRGSEKTLAIWSFVKNTVFNALSEFGVRAERVALKGFKEEELATGTGYMRSRGWQMKMSFDEEIGGKPALEALQTYTRKLEEKYGKKAFQHFSDADMQVLLIKK